MSDDGRSRILHVDQEFVVVVKASGLLAVPGRGPDKLDSVSERIRRRFEIPLAHPAPHRLDMDTSGLMVIARTAEALRHLSRQFAERRVRKRYEAMLEGVVDGEAGTIELSTRLDVDRRPIQIVDPVHGKPGVTHWRVLERPPGRTRVELIPETGRTHQLRVHCASPAGLGIAIVGDPFYGDGDAPGEMLLHAGELEFHHPLTGAPVSFLSPAPF